jgi:putative ABC transport system permease protein
MKYLATLMVALRGIFAHKLRSFLTMLGVIIGIGSIIAMMAVGEGSEKSILADLSDMGSDAMWVEPGAGMMGRIAGAPGSTRNLTYDDYLAMEESPELIPAIKDLTAQVSTRLQIIAGEENVNATVAGVTPDYLEFNNVVLTSGESFTFDDVDSKAMVCVLGSKIAEDLFGNEDPVGSKVRVKGRSLEVIGALESDGKGNYTSADRQLLLPITTVMYRINPQYSIKGEHLVNMIGMQADEGRVDDAVEQITAFLRERHDIGPGDEDDFTVNVLQDYMDMMTNTNDTLKILLRWTSALALLIAGIGIMNIMLVSVTERTREIGIRKAVGAKRHHILIQFLLEATTISLIGGIIGIGAGYLAAEYAFNSLEVNQMGGLQQAPIEPIVSASIVLWSFLVAIIVGIVSGTYPAIRASRLNPIEALRYE